MYRKKEGDIMRADALIFDMDGVITDTEGLHVEAEQWVCQKYGITIPNTEWSKFTGKTNRAIFLYIAENFTDGTISAEELCQEKRMRYMEIARKGMTPIPGAIDFVQFARMHFSQMALVTSSNNEIMELVCKRYGLHPYFDVVVTGNDIIHSKPHPESYLLALKKLRASPKLSCVIEDSTNGVISAKAAGCQVVGITTSFSRKTLIKSGADIVINSFNDLYALLQ